MRGAATLIAVAVLLPACRSASPRPAPPDHTVPSTDASIQWSSNKEQAVVSWPDMPIVVYGGDERWVLRRSATVLLPKARPLRAVQSFIGVDRGDVGEMHAVVHGIDGITRYARSEHHEDGNDENYDAYDSQKSLSPSATEAYVVDVLCRATGENHNPHAFPRQSPLSVFCHIEVTLFFGSGGCQ